MKKRRKFIPSSTWKAVSSCSEVGLRALASELAFELQRGDRVFLEGALGAGKSTFARFLIEALGVSQPPEGSPTFAIAHEYFSKKGDVIHIDFYRLKSEHEIDEAGVSAYFWERDAIVLSEWATQFPEFYEKVRTASTGRVWNVDLKFSDSDDHRSVKINTQAAS